VQPDARISMTHFLSVVSNLNILHLTVNLSVALLIGCGVQNGFSWICVITFIVQEWGASNLVLQGWWQDLSSEVNYYCPGTGDFNSSGPAGLAGMLEFRG
jgi:hypothetical protein